MRGFPNKLMYPDTDEIWKEDIKCQSGLLKAVCIFDCVLLIFVFASCLEMKVFVCWFIIQSLKSS